MPSCVMWHHDKYIVGQEAYEHREQPNVIYSVKRLMQETGATVTLVDGNDRIELTPSEVSAKILRGLVEETGGIYGEIKDVVVTVPAYFNQIGRDNTREACYLAGLNPISIINEPTAASLCYEQDLVTGSSEVIVYDLGGGTFDLTIAKITSTKGADDLDDIYDFAGVESENNSEDGKSVNVIATAGDSHLGGDDLDRELYEIVAAKLRQFGIDASKFTEEYKENLILRLEQLKKRSVQETYSMNITTLGTDGREIRCDVTILPEDFRNATEEIYKRTKKLLKNVLRKNHTTAKNLVLVGGSTKNIWLREFLKQDFPQFTISTALNPDQSVADGAAIHGKGVKFGDSNVSVFDILPLSIGVLDAGSVSPILLAGTCLPTAETKVFTTSHDDQSSLAIRLFQGNSVYAEECVEIGEITIDKIEKRPAGVPNLFITLSVSANSELTCTAKVDGKERVLKIDLGGRSTSAEAKAGRTLSRNEKAIIKWRRVAGDCPDVELADRLNAAIDEFSADSSKQNKSKVLKLVTEAYNAAK